MKLGKGRGVTALSVEVLPAGNPILDYLRPFAAGYDEPVFSTSPDHVIARQFLEENRLCWFEEPGEWSRLDQRGVWIPASRGEVHHLALSHLEKLSIVGGEELDAKVKAMLDALAGKPERIFHRAKRIVACAKWFCDPPSLAAHSEEFCRQWVTPERGNQRAHIASDDLWRLYRVMRSGDPRGERDIREDLSVAISNAFGIRKSHNLPNPKGKQRRGWWGLRWARPLPEGFHDSDE